MPLKEKTIGLLLIIIGALPFLLKIQAIGDFFDKYSFLSYLTPGEVIYQLIIIALGVLLIWTLKAKVRANY